MAGRRRVFQETKRAHNAKSIFYLGNVVGRWPVTTNWWRGSGPTLEQPLDARQDGLRVVGLLLKRPVLAQVARGAGGLRIA